MSAVTRFSRRTPSRRRPTALAAERDRLGSIPYDLTISNPTRCGLPYPGDLLGVLANPAALDYDPCPRGAMVARRAVAESLRRSGGAADPDRIVLTSSTSEAYGYLFRLLADPGDAVLVPAPSYPLFDQLARLDGVRVEHYPLDPVAGWSVDRTAVDAAPDHVRAVVAVHPNNPTGSLVGDDDRRWLIDSCRRHGRALIVDEVFLPYHLIPPAPASFAGTEGCLTFTLGGLSKQAGLPQLKLSWLAASGPEALVEEALDRLDWVADAYLSVGTPVARALPDLLAASAPVTDAIAARCRHNLATLTGLARAVPAVTVHPPEGGWSVVLRVPRIVDDELLALTLLGDGVAVHPGHLFDFPGDGWLVLSLLAPEEVFREGVRRLLARVETLMEIET
jgi:aspartate/methionine/tyrosine aminotransferase